MNLKFFLFLIFCGFECTVLNTNTRVNVDRKLGLFGGSPEDKLEEEYQSKKSVNNMRMLMTNMERDTQLKALEASLNDVVDVVDEIAEVAGAKLQEINDAIESKRGKRLM